MQMQTQTAVLIARGRGEVFRIATIGDNLPKIFSGKGPIPGIRRVQLVGDGPIVAGTVRQVMMTDGSTLLETFTEFTPGSSFAYQMSQLRPLLSYLVTAAGGAWVFADEGSATRVTWTYTCDLTTPLVAPVAALVIKVFMKAAMAECLAGLKALIEGQS